MTRVSGSSSQYSSRSLPDTSALLPTLTNVERPTCRSAASSRIAMPSAPLCDESATWPAGGKIGENDAFSRTSGFVFSSAHAVGADHPHAVAAHLLDERVLPRASLGADFRESGRDDDERLHARRGAVVDRRQDALRRHRDDREIDAGGQVARGAKRRQARRFPRRADERDRSGR